MTDSVFKVKAVAFRKREDWKLFLHFNVKNDEPDALVDSNVSLLVELVVVEFIPVFILVVVELEVIIVWLLHNIYI